MKCELCGAALTDEEVANTPPYLCAECKALTDIEDEERDYGGAEE